MRISVADLRKGPKEVDINLSPKQLALHADGAFFAARILGKAKLQLFGKRVLMRGTLETSVHTACVRCLGPLDHPIAAKIELVFEPRPATDEKDKADLDAEWEAESREIDYYDEEMVDPTDSLRQLILLELPDYPLCSESCRGLCPYCGANLNAGDCNCQEKADAAIDESDWKARLRKIQLT